MRKTRTLAIALLAAACAREEPNESGHGHGHHHAAPHGGSLAALGDHFAHVELLFDEATGKLTLHLLDGEAEKALRSAQPSLEATAERADGEEFRVTLHAAADPLTGEKPGDSARFAGICAELKGAKTFHLTVAAIAVKGSEWKDVRVAYPGDGE